jgi:hypothetical protein
MWFQWVASDAVVRDGCLAIPGDMQNIDFNFFNFNQLSRVSLLGMHAPFASSCMCSPIASTPNHPNPMTAYIFDSGALEWSIESVKLEDVKEILTHLKLFFISRNFVITATGSVSPVTFWISGS